MDDPQRILHEAEQEGYGLVASLREGDRYFDTLLRKHVAVKRVQPVAGEDGLAANQRTAIIVGVDDEGEKVTVIRPMYNLYPTEYTDEHAAEIFGEETQQAGWW